MTLAEFYGLAPAIPPGYAPPGSTAPTVASTGAAGPAVRSGAEIRSDLDQLPHYIGPHATQALSNASQLAAMFTPKFGFPEGAEAGREIDAGNYGRAAGALGFGTAGAALDMIPGSSAVKGILGALRRGSQHISDFTPAAGLSAAPSFGDLMKGWSATEGKEMVAKVAPAARSLPDRRPQRFLYDDEVPSAPQPQTRGSPEALGFDSGTYYHGADMRSGAQPFGFRDPAGKDEQAIFLATDPSVAQHYGDTILPLKARLQNAREIDWPSEVRRQTGAGSYDGYDTSVMQRLINESRAAGHDGVRIRNFADYGGPQEQVLVFNPSQLRSPWAAFDPALKHSPYLLGGLAGMALLPAGLGSMFLPPRTEQ